MAANKATEKDIYLQNKYINSWKQNNTPLQDYRYITGFRFKKWMYGHRCKDNTQQNWINTTFDIHDYSCAKREEPDTIVRSNYCRVGSVIFPEMYVNKARVHQIIVECQKINIWGAFLFTYQMTAPGNKFCGRLYSVILNNFDYPAINSGAVNAVYPYYTPVTHEYRPYLEFNYNNIEPSLYQSRFRANERVGGVHEYNTAEALNRIRDHCETLYNNKNNRLVAFYVQQFTTLAVRFLNNKFDHLLNGLRGFPNNCKTEDERVLIQHHGLVLLVDYDLYFKVSKFQNYQKFTSEQMAIYDPVFKCNHPLISLRMTTDPQLANVKQPHFAGYYLEIQNLGQNKEAYIHLPSGSEAKFYDLLSEGMDGEKIIESQGLKFMREQWFEEKFTDMTGPFTLISDGRTRQAFPGMFE